LDWGGAVYFQLRKIARLVLAAQRYGIHLIPTGDITVYGHECEVRPNFSGRQPAMVPQSCIDACLSISLMKIFHKWLRPSPQQGTVSKEYDSVRRAAEKTEVSGHVPHQTLAPEGDSRCGAEDDTGYDPYNTGRFNIPKE
jgi:hypothetical protein